MAGFCLRQQCFVLEIKNKDKTQNKNAEETVQEAINHLNKSKKNYNCK